MSGWPGQKVGGTQPAAMPAQAPARPQGGPVTRTIASAPNPQQDVENQRNVQNDAQTAADKERQRLKDTFRTMTPEESKAAGLPAGGVYQVNGLGEFKQVAAAPATGAPQTVAQNSVVAAGIDLRAKDDRIADLIMKSTSGGLETAAANAYGYVTGGSTDGMQAIAALRPIVADLVLQASGGSLGAQISDGDRKFIMERMGNIADPEVPADQRLASWNEVKRRLANSLGVPLNEVTFAGEQAPGSVASSYKIVSEAESAAIFGEPMYDAQGNPVGNDYNGDALYDKNGNFVSANIRITDDSPDPRVKELADQWEAQNGPAGLNQLASQGTTLTLADEAAGVGMAAGRLLRGDTNFTDNYQLYTAVERELVRRARERTGALGTATELLGGGGAVRAIGLGATTIGGAFREGATIGGVAGFGSGEGMQDSLASAATGAAIGGTLGAGLQRLAGGGRSGGSGGGSGGNAPVPTTPGGQVIQAADNFNAATGANVQPLPADVGGTLTRRATGGVAQTTFGAAPIVDAAQAVNTEAQAGIRALAGRQGAVPASKQAAGEVAIKGADKTMARAKLKVDALYSKARKAAGDAQIELPMAQATLQKHINELSQVPGGGEGLSTLQALASDIAGKRFPVDGIKAMRTQLRDKFLKDGLRGSDVERRVNEVIDAAELDIEDGLIALGNRDAAQAYADASKAAAERFTLIDDVLAPVLGKRGEKSGEQAFAAIEQLSRGDAVTLGKFMRALPDEEAGSIRGAIIDRLGRASKGRQDADGQAFSLSDFLTRWNDEGLSREAKAVLFDGETIAALDDLARVAQGTKEGQRFANFSNTGGVNFLNFFLNGAPLGAASAGAVPAAGAAAFSVGSQIGLGRLLASPKFARWLAKMPKQNSAGAVRAHLQGLTKIAAADAAIAADALGLQQQLLGAFRQGAGPIAAEDQSAGSNTKRPETQ